MNLTTFTIRPGSGICLNQLFTKGSCTFKEVFRKLNGKKSSFNTLLMLNDLVFLESENFKFANRDVKKPY